MTRPRAHRAGDPPVRAAGRPSAAARPGAARPATALAALAALLLFAAGALSTAEAARRFRDGDRVEVTGLVTDTDGRPLPGVRVVLEASRTRFDFRRFRRVATDTTRLTALTDDKGAYELTWPWNGYYNLYELLVGVPVRRAGGEEKLHVLERLELSRRLKPDEPTVATVVVEDADFVRTLRAFLDSIDSDDERRVYREQGKPDRIEEKTGGVDEALWWYFESGTVYRFRGGRLVETESFEPVEEF